MRIVPKAACFDGKSLWVQASEINAIFKIDISENYKMKYVGSLMESYTPDSWKLTRIIAYENRVFFFSDFVYEYWIYDKESCEFSHHIIMQQKYVDGCCVALCDKSIWIVPRTFSEKLIKIDAIKLIVDYFSLDMNEWKGADSNRITEVTVKDSALYFSTRKPSNIVIVKVETDGFSVKSIVSKDLKRVSCIYLDNNELRILGKDFQDKVLIESLSVNEEIISFYENICVDYPNDDSYDSPYYTVERYGVKLVFIPCHTQEILVFNSSEEKIKKITYTKTINELLRIRRASFFYSYNVRDRIYLLSRVLPYVVCFDCKRETFDRIDLVVDEKDENFEKKIKNEFLKKKVMTESHLFKLKEFLKNLI